MQPKLPMQIPKRWPSADPTPIAAATPLATIDSLRMSISTEGPTKSYKGGLYADTMLRHGKTMTIEMEDAIMRVAVLEHLFGIKENGTSRNIICQWLISNRSRLHMETFYRKWSRAKRVN